MSSRTADRAARALSVRVCEVCDLLNIHTDIGYQWIRQGQFPVPVRKTGSQYYVLRSDVEAFFAPGRHERFA
jgi:excisionase family DNA binding protein